MKMVKKSNFRVEVYPSNFYGVRDLDEKEAMQECKRIIDEVKRHIDFGSVNIEFDTEEVCGYCDNTWEVSKVTDEDWITGEPMCCTKASNEFREQLKAKEEPK